MQLPGVCVCCGRTINKEYPFCPWCGTEQNENNLNVVCVCDEKDNTSRLMRINRTLHDLEQDMTVFIMRNERNY